MDPQVRQASGILDWPQRPIQLCKDNRVLKLLALLAFVLYCHVYPSK